MIELNKKQKIVYDALKKFYSDFGEMPSIRELQRAIEFFGLKLKSPRSILIYLDELEEMGLIRRNPVTREVEILDKSKMLFSEIPIYGGANCGVATICAEQFLQGMLRVSKNILGRKNTEDIFAIQASGDSMNDYKIRGKRIEDGDYLLVDSGYTPQSHDKDIPVLAVIDGLATIKLLRFVGDGRIGLFPQTRKKGYSPVYLSSDDDFIINGKVIDVLKS